MAKLSSATTNVTVEASDSTCSNYPLQTKILKHDSHISPSRFKGVVGQHNGRWGAQIYANHQRVWLGTFKSENEAAMAYDSAAIKLRNGESYRNFPWTSITHHEPNFQSQFTTEAILNMIKDGSYPSKFAAYLKAQSGMGEIEVRNLAPLLHDNAGLLCRQLFQKELTPSDVSKLNRLVIPKNYALKYFPNILDNSEKKEEASGEVDDVELVFFDGSMNSWRFRYCYWKSSRSFVFTKGWNKFVRDKELKAKDTVIFALCGDGLNEAHAFFMIDVCYCGGGESTEALCVGSGENTINMKEAEGEKDLVSVLESNDAEKDLVSVLESNGACKNGLRLFGVQLM